MDQLLDSLEGNLRRSLIGFQIPERLTEAADVINRYYTDLTRLAPDSLRGSDYVPYRANRPTIPRRDPDAMDLDSATTGYAPKGSEERRRRKKKGLCFKCGSRGHISPNCSVPMPTQRELRESSSRYTTRPTSPTSSVSSGTTKITRSRSRSRDRNRSNGSGKGPSRR